MSDILTYKPTLHQVIARYQGLYAATGPGHLCTFISAPYTGEPMERKPLTEVDWTSWESIDAYLDLTLRNAHRGWQDAIPIADDNIPCGALFVGIGEYSAYVAGEVTFSEDTSWSTPVLERWEDLDKLTLSEDRRWYRILAHTIQHLCDHCRPLGIPVVRGYYSPLDLAHALRGPVLFTDFVDSPQQVHRLMDFCTTATIWVAERIQDIIGQSYGGQVAGAWLPPGTVCMSEDIACLVSPRVYATFARPYTQRVIDHFGHGQIHTHSLGHHVIPEISRLNNLMGIQVAEDPNTKHTFEHLDSLLERCTTVPLTVSCTLDELRARVADLSRRTNIILCPMLDDRSQIDEALALIRSHSRI
jgi:hypothetical protein